MKQAPLFTKTTNGIRIDVFPIFLPEQSDPKKSLYFWAYYIAIENQSEETVQLLSRFWRIIDENGRINEVRGDGVIGQQPILKPKEQHSYTSSVNLATPSGVMMGSYNFRIFSTQKDMQVEVPTFSLDSPFEEHKPA